MAKQEQQQQALVEYFAQGCKAEGCLRLGLEAEHFVTHEDGEPLSFEEVQELMHAMQPEEAQELLVDQLYMGYAAPEYTVTLEPACQLEISVAPQTEIAEMMRIYTAFCTQLQQVLKARGMRFHNVGYHPTRRADALPLIPKIRYEAMDRYFQKIGPRGRQMMRATASTQISIDYSSEADCIQKLRAAVLLTPLFALLTDHAPTFERAPNHTPSVRTEIWQAVDPDRCGVPPLLFAQDYGFAQYAQGVLRCPQIVALRDGRIRAVGKKSALDLYGAQLDRTEIEQILSMVFYDVRLKSYIEIRAADCMPAEYIAAYAQLIKCVFGSPAALQNVLRHYRGMTAVDVIAAKTAVCRDGFQAWTYGRPVASECAWLLAQARSRAANAEARALLQPLVTLVNNKRTLREELLSR